MIRTVAIKCDCGQVRGKANGVSNETGLRTICMCDDCQAYIHYLGRAKDLLDQNGGVDIYPMTPSQLSIDSGFEHVRCVRLSEKGMYRWYAGCCKSPIASAPAQTFVPFNGVSSSVFDLAPMRTTRNEILGPVGARIMAKFGIAPLPPGAAQKAPLGFILRSLGFLIPALIRGEHNPSPFFKDGKPKATPEILTVTQRDHLRQFCGPRPSSLGV